MNLLPLVSFVSSMEYLHAFLHGMRVTALPILAGMFLAASVTEDEPPEVDLILQETSTSLQPMELVEADRLFTILIGQLRGTRMGMPRPINEIRREDTVVLGMGRTLASAAPEHLVPMLARAAFDPDAPRAHRQYSVMLLGDLARVGNPRARSTLADLADEDDPFVADLALELLAVAGLPEDHRWVFCRAALAGRSEALEILASCSDVLSEVVLRWIAGRPANDRGMATPFVDRARELLENRLLWR